MINADKFKGDYQQLSRLVNQINQRVRQLEKMGYNVSEVSQNAELYNKPEKMEKLLKKYEQIMSPDYIDELHQETLETMENNLKQMFGEDIKVDLTPAQLKEFIKRYPEYSALTTKSPEKAKQELQKAMDLVGGTKEGIIMAIRSVQTPQAPVVVPRPKFKKKRKKGRR